MYTKEDVIKFGTYLLSEERAKKIEFEHGLNPEKSNNLRNELLTVTEADFDAVWPPIKHELTQEDLDVNGAVADAEGNDLKAGDIVEIPTTPGNILTEEEVGKLTASEAPSHPVTDGTI